LRHPAVAAGQSYICREVVNLVVTTVRDSPQAAETPRLSLREREVLGLVCQGYALAGDRQPAAYRPRTVEVHRRNIMRKLEVRTVAELTRYAIREGLVVA